MKKHNNAYFFFFILVVLQTTAGKLYAQTGWNWAVGSHSTVSNFETTSIAVDNTGDIYSVGYATNSDLNFGSFYFTDATSNDMIIVKTDALGNYLWVFGTSTSNVFPIEIITDTRGNVYAYGYYTGGAFYLGSITLSSGTLNPMYFLAKISPSGTALWAENIATKTTSVAAPVLFTLAGDQGWMGIDGSDHIYLTGYFNSPSVVIGPDILVNANSSGITADIFIAKYDTLGNAIWAERAGGIANDVTGAMAVTQQGDFYISGSSASDSLYIGSRLFDTLSPRGTFNFLAKYDSSGHPTWAHSVSSHVGIASMTTDAYERLYVCGQMDTSVILGNDTLPAVTFPPAGDIDSFYNYLVACYDPSGNVLWARAAANGSTSGMYGVGAPTKQSIVLDNCGFLWVSGTMDSSMIFNDTAVLTPSGMDPMFVAEYSYTGTYLRSMSFPSGGDDWSAISVDNTGNFYLAGDFHDTNMVFGVDTIPHPVVVNLEQFFLAKNNYILISDCSGVGPLATVNNLKPVTETNVYPNPASDNIFISSPGDISHVEIYDILGRKLFSENCESEVVEIDISGFSPGIYLIKINGVDIKKFIKQ